MSTDDNASRYLSAVTEAVDSARDELVEISLDIHAHPELGHREHRASGLLADFLERRGFEVERGVAGVETAFSATVRGAGTGGRKVAILAEYDALPDVGHGCGHNLIALTAIGAGIGAQAALADLPGTVVVLGTLAEETAGAKIDMLEADLFEDVDVVLSSHPSSHRTLIRDDVPIGESLSLALVGNRYTFHGKSAHAASAPHLGVNALNAAIQLFTGIDALRQHLRDDARVHGIITEGGTAPNVVPEYAATNFLLRAKDREYLQEIVEKVQGVAEGAAAATGARLEILSGDPLYENVRPNTPLAKAARRNAGAVQLKIDEPVQGEKYAGASTDFGNVSQALPSYALSFAVSETPIPGHSTEMARAAESKLGLDNAVLVAKILALTTCDVLDSPDLPEAARADFAARSGG